MNTETNGADNGRPRRTRNRRNRIRFERNPSQVVFNPVSKSYVVTWAKCNLPAEARISKQKDCSRWRPSVSAMAMLFDRGRVDMENTIAAARTIGESWRLGDRFLLDTDDSKRAAELVSDLSRMCVDPNDPTVIKDLRQAMRHLVDEIASARFASEPEDSFDEDKVIPTLIKAMTECLAIESFGDWPAQSRRRRFLYCLNKHERTRVAYTLTALMFDTGACPLLSLSDSRTIRAAAVAKSGVENVHNLESARVFFEYSLRRMREMKQGGISRLNDTLTQQQLLDCVAGKL